MNMTKEIAILYASQTGNSAQAAEDIQKQATSSLKKLGVELSSKPCLYELDDFLEQHGAPWTRVVVIVVSSYGVGQAPLGGRRFREWCDSLMEVDNRQLLQGLHFALCGLGDSNFTTFLKNPTTVDTALQSAGAQRVGEMGKADASGKGDQEQSVVVDRWIQKLWPQLANVLQNEETLSSGRLEEIQRDTMALARKINPDLQGEAAMSSHTVVKASSSTIVPHLPLLVAVLIAVLGLGISQFYYH